MECGRPIQGAMARATIRNLLGATPQNLWKSPKSVDDFFPVHQRTNPVIFPIGVIMPWALSLQIDPCPSTSSASSFHRMVY